MAISEIDSPARNMRIEAPKKLMALPESRVIVRNSLFPTKPRFQLPEQLSKENPDHRLTDGANSLPASSEF